MKPRRPAAAHASATASEPVGASAYAPHRMLFVVMVVASTAALFAGCGSLASRGDGGRVDVGDPGVIHVHGLALDPADGRLYAATHTGLLRIDGDGSATRIGDAFQDTMGLTIAGPNRFLASGHPDLRDLALQRPGRPPLLGLVESIDAGGTWRSLSLLGEADLHSISRSSGVLVAYDSTGGQVLVSRDGRDWELRSTIALVDLAAHPEDPDRLVALAAGGILVSGDGGRSWTPRSGPPSALQVLRWGASGVWGGATDGTLYTSGAEGQWTMVHRFDGGVEAVLVDDATIVAAVEGSGIYRSDDTGRSWKRIYRAGGLSG